MQQPYHNSGMSFEISGKCRRKGAHRFVKHARTRICIGTMPIENRMRQYQRVMRFRLVALPEVGLCVIVGKNDRYFRQTSRYDYQIGEVQECLDA